MKYKNCDSQPPNLSELTQLISLNPDAVVLLLTISYCCGEMDTVFFSQITRKSNHIQNNLYDLLDICPAKPTAVISSKEYECDFRPQTNKVYILKKKHKLKVKTVRDIRSCFEKDVLYELPKELDKQTNVLLRKIKSGSIQDGKTKSLAKNILNSDMPITRQSWQMLMNINPENREYPSQFVLWKGKCIQVNGSKGGKNKFLCNQDLDKFWTIKSNESKKNSIQKKILPKKKNLLRNSLSINFKPGPLTRKKYLDASYQKYNVGNIELVNLPKLGLELMPTYGTNLDPSIANLIGNFREVDGIISPKWADFAVSMIGSVRGSNLNQTNKNCKTTFHLDYKHNQQRALMRRCVENKKRLCPVMTQANNVLVDNSVELLPEIKVILEKILDAVEVHINEDNYFTGNDEPRISEEQNITIVSNAMTKEKSKRKYCELDRLDVKVINISENPTTNDKSECHNTFCTLGCICNSLQCTFNFKNHCGRLECMFKCECDFIKYNAIDTKESDCCEFLPGLLNLDNCNHKLSKEEQKFQQTVIVTDDKSILLKSKKRNWKSSTKYADFYSKMCLKSDIKKEKSLAVIDIKLNLKNVVPWCMVHCLYNCFCKCKFVDNITTDRPLNRIEKDLDEINNEPDTNEDLDINKNYECQSNICKTETNKEYQPDDDVTFVSSSQFHNSCARVKAYKDRNFSNKYYTTIHSKIKELEYNDIFIQQKLISLVKQSVNICVDNTIKTISKTQCDTDAEASNSNLKLSNLTDNNKLPEMSSSMDNICAAKITTQVEINMIENDASTESQLKLVEVDPKCSSPKKVQNVNSKTENTSELQIFDILKNKPILNRPQLVAWVESGYKHYKKRLEMGKQFVLDPPKKGKITLYAWDFILNRYSERKNLFLVSKKAPYRIFIAIHTFAALSQHCINIDEIRFADLNKYPVTVKNLLTSNKGPKDSFCLLYGLSHCWELVSSIVKTKDNPNDTAESEIENEFSQNSADTSGEQHQSDDSTLDKDFKNEGSVSLEDNNIKESSKWFVMTIENDFSEIQFYNHNFFVKYGSIIQSIEVARKTGKTVRLSPLRTVDKTNEPQFGIYAVPATKDYCVFIGPYETDESLGIETIKTSIIDKKMKRTRGVWVCTNKVDNIKVVDNPISFIPLDKLTHCNMVPIVNDSIEPLEQNINSILDPQPSQEIVAKKRNGKPVIKVRKSNRRVKFVSKPELWNTSQKVSSLKNAANTTRAMISILKNNDHTAPNIESTNTINENILPKNLPPIDKLPIIIDTGTGELDTNFANLTPIQPKRKKPVAEVAPQIKISAIYSATDVDKLTNSPRSDTGMLILKPEEINRRLSMQANLCTMTSDTSPVEVSSDQNNMMDIEDFLDSAVTCDDYEPYLISDDESEIIKNVLIKCKNVQQFGMIRGRIDKEGNVSFEFPGFKYTEFYDKDVAFTKINQVLSRKVCVPKYLTLEWQIVDNVEDQTNKLLKAEDLGSDMILTKKGLLKKNSLIKVYAKNSAEAAGTSVTVTTNNTEQMKTYQDGSKLCSGKAGSSVAEVDDALFCNTQIITQDAIVKSISEATNDDRKRLTATLEYLLQTSYKI
ncbi:hypothetical protein ACJJTC_011745 [Scirpophaga incertulas]